MARISSFRRHRSDVASSLAASQWRDDDNEANGVLGPSPSCFFAGKLWAHRVRDSHFIPAFRTVAPSRLAKSGDFVACECSCRVMGVRVNDLEHPPSRHRDPGFRAIYDGYSTPAPNTSGRLSTFLLNPDRTDPVPETFGPRIHFSLRSRRRKDGQQIQAECRENPLLSRSQESWAFAALRLGEMFSQVFWHGSPTSSIKRETRRRRFTTTWSPTGQFQPMMFHVQLPQQCIPEAPRKSQEGVGYDCKCGLQMEVP